MKNRILLLLLLSISLAACRKDNMNTVSLPVGGLSTTVIPAEIREDIEANMTLHEGITPPIILGGYVATNPTCTSYSVGASPAGVKFATLYFAFENGQQTGRVGNYYEKWGPDQQESNDVTVQVLGEDDVFTAYFITSGTSTRNGVQATFSSSIVITGRKTDTGIADMEYALILLEKDDPGNMLMPANSWRIFKEADGLASYSSWHSSSKPALPTAAESADSEPQCSGATSIVSLFLREDQP